MPEELAINYETITATYAETQEAQDSGELGGGGDFILVDLVGAAASSDPIADLLTRQKNVSSESTENGIDNGYTTGDEEVEHAITHEIGHSIGLRHTDYFNRASDGEIILNDFADTTISGGDDGVVDITDAGVTEQAIVHEYGHLIGSYHTHGGKDGGGGGGDSFIFQTETEARDGDGSQDGADLDIIHWEIIDGVAECHTDDCGNDAIFIVDVDSSVKYRRPGIVLGELVSMLSDTVPFPARWKGNGSSLERDDGCRF